MSNRLKQTLLSDIISGKGIYQHKYSTAYNWIKAVIELEKKEKINKIPDRLFNKFKEIEFKTINGLNERFAGIPLLILEQYFFRNNNDLNNYIAIEFRYSISENEEKTIEVTNIYCTDLYLLLEEFFNEIYFLAIEILDFYSLEIKLKNEKTIGKENTFL